MYFFIGTIFWVRWTACMMPNQTQRSLRGPWRCAACTPQGGPDCAPAAATPQVLGTTPLLVSSLTTLVLLLCSDILFVRRHKAGHNSHNAAAPAGADAV